MTPPRELQNSDLYQQAIEQFDATLDEVAGAVSAASSERVRDILDRWKAATHQLLRAHRYQVIDDCTAVVTRAELAFDERLKALEAWAYGTAKAEG